MNPLINICRRTSPLVNWDWCGISHCSKQFWLFMHYWSLLHTTGMFVECILWPVIVFLGKITEFAHCWAALNSFLFGIAVAFASLLAWNMQSFKWLLGEFAFSNMVLVASVIQSDLYFPFLLVVWQTFQNNCFSEIDEWKWMTLNWIPLI